MKNWAVLFARTGSEEKLAKVIGVSSLAETYLPFVPYKEMPYRNKGVIHRVCVPLFPGYVFVQADIDVKIMGENLTQLQRSQKDIFSLLHYGQDKSDIALHMEERMRWERLLGDNFCISGSVGFIEGDSIRITSGALVGMESQIKKINRHKREAVIEIEIMGALRQVRTMLEVVEKVR